MVYLCHPNHCPKTNPPPDFIFVAPKPPRENPAGVVVVAACVEPMPPSENPVAACMVVAGFPWLMLPNENPAAGPPIPL
jgi:hypothetical protein